MDLESFTQIRSLSDAIAWVAGFGQWWALPVLSAAACIEYVFPPFPGDTVTVAGAVLARVAGWSFLNVFAALTLGSLVGSALDFAVGRLLCRGGQTEATGDAAGGSSPERQAGLARILAGFRKYGPIFLVVNRFLPGIRAFFFVAAGMARIPLWKVLFYSTLSAAAWNGLLLLAGWLIGDNLPQLEELVRTYFAVAWILLAVVALVVGVRWWQGRRASRPAP